MKQKKHGSSVCRARSVTLPQWPSIKDFTDRPNDWTRAAELVGRQAKDNSPPRELEKHYPLRDVEDSWGVSYSTLCREIGRENLNAVKIGGQWRISESSLADYLNAREKPLRLPGHGRRSA